MQPHFKWFLRLSKHQIFGCRLASSLDSAHKEFKTQQGEDEPLRRGVEVNQIIFTNSAPKRSVFSRDPSYEERLKVELFSVCIKKSRPHLQHRMC